MSLKYVILSLLFGVFLISCEDTDDVMNGPDGTTVEASRIVGEWTVYRYTDGNDDETSFFRNIILQFDQDGDFFLKRGGQVIASGDWQLRDRNTELDINVPALAGENESLGEDIYEIHDDWDIRLDNEGRMILTEEDEQFILQRLSS